jgi:hypothetical protein
VEVLVSIDDRDDTKLARERAKQEREREATFRRFARWAWAGGLVLLWVVYVPLNAAGQLPNLPQYIQAPFVLAVLILVQSGYETGRSIQLERALEAAVTVDLRRLQDASDEHLATVKREIADLERKHFTALERLSSEGVRELAEHVDKAMEKGIAEGAVQAAREIAALVGGLSAVHWTGAEAGVVDMEDVRLLKRLEERVRGTQPEH